MKRFIYKNSRIIIMFLIVLLSLSIIGCGKKEEEVVEPVATATPTPTPTPTPKEITTMTKIQDKGYLVVACEPAEPPYIYVKKENNEFNVMGAEFDFAKQIAQQLGVELIVKNVKQSDILVGLETGLYDLGFNHNELSLLEQVSILISQQYFINEYPVIINNIHIDDFKSLDDFKDKRFGVMRQTVEYFMVKEQSHKYTKVRQYETESKMIDNLMTDYLHAVCLDAYKARYYLDKYPDLIYMQDVILVPEDAKGRAICVSKEKADFASYIDETIENLTEDKFLLTKLGISVTDYAKNTIEVDTSCTDYVGILYGK